MVLIKSKNYYYFLLAIENGLAGLEIKGKVRTLSPVLFYQTNTRYLIMSNNELKYLPSGKKIFIKILKNC